MLLGSRLSEKLRYAPDLWRYARKSCASQGTVDRQVRKGDIIQSDNKNYSESLFLILNCKFQLWGILAFSG